MKKLLLSIALLTCGSFLDAANKIHPYPVSQEHTRDYVGYASSGGGMNTFCMKDKKTDDVTCTIRSSSMMGMEQNLDGNNAHALWRNMQRRYNQDHQPLRNLVLDFIEKNKIDTAKLPKPLLQRKK